MCTEASFRVCLCRHAFLRGVPYFCALRCGDCEAEVPSFDLVSRATSESADSGGTWCSASRGRFPRPRVLLFERRADESTQSNPTYEENKIARRSRREKQTSGFLACFLLPRFVKLFASNIVTEPCSTKERGGRQTQSRLFASGVRTPETARTRGVHTPETKTEWPVTANKVPLSRGEQQRLRMKSLATKRCTCPFFDGRPTAVERSFSCAIVACLFSSGQASSGFSAVRFRRRLPQNACVTTKCSGANISLARS
uniref:Uncharacterized protein n=1 Tax=Toxoplasma gondii (strain ATCC 50861 / VEG) TaxID=432359 RepID=A0A0F7UN56_TOXGV|nr:TPA: hypothetical protein BN1205_012960 [Toxoplasma gondii VEG]